MTGYDFKEGVAWTDRRGVDHQGVHIRTCCGKASVLCTLEGHRMCWELVPVETLMPCGG